VVSRQHPRSTRLLVVVLVSISLAVITLDYREGETGPLAGLGRTALAVMAPLQKAVTTVTRPIGNFFSGLVHLPSLENDNQQLERANEALRAEVASGTDTQSQLDQLSALLGLKESLAPSSVPAIVIANGLSNFRYTITVDKGSADGVAMDQPVVTGSAQAPILVGRVVFVSANSAEVQLIIDRNSTVAGRLSVSHETGQVQGEGEGDLRMTLVTPGTSVAGDETVVTQGYEVNGQQGLYPPGLVIGQVSRVIPGTDGLQEFVTVRPPIDFSGLEFVLVLQTSRDEG
jgi:rod shape-determining protein MreC